MFKYFQYVFAIFKAHLFRRRVPIFVVICLTSRCNMRCVYCYADYLSSEQHEIPKDKVLALIDELKAMGTRYVSINGGEALLRNDLDQIVERIKGHGMLCHLSTNGLLVRSRLPLLKKIDSLAISLDGARPGNDLNRGEGTYERILAGLKALQAEGIAFHTHTVLTKNNKNAVEEILALARQMNFQAQFSLLRVEDTKNKDIALTDDELRPIIERLVQEKRRGGPVFFSRLAYENYLNWPFSADKQIIWGKAPEGFRPITCYIKRFSCHIEANGLVYPCVVLVNKYPALNFLEVGFRKCWERLGDNECLSCHNICCNDMNLIYGLNPRSIWSATAVVWHRLFRKTKT